MARVQVKPLDYILLLLAFFNLWRVIGAYAYTSEIVQTMCAKEFNKIVHRRMLWFAFPCLIVIWRVWG